MAERIKISPFFFLLVLLLFPHAAKAQLLTSDTVWKGEVTVSEDVLVPAGVTLTIAPGTVVRVVGAESSRTDPEYLSPLTEITVRGALVAEGEKGRPISFLAAGERRQGAWAGIIVDGGSASLSGCRVESAESAVHLLNGTLRLNDSTLSASRYGLVLQGAASAVWGGGNLVSGNDFGVLSLSGAPEGKGIATCAGNRKRDWFVAAASPFPGAPKAPEVPRAAPGRSYGDEVLSGETVWRGTVLVQGTLRVPQGSRLVILPGTVVEFAFRDTNGDGIGENGLLVQGALLAKGTAASPIVFRAAGPPRRRGGWDAINVMNSAGQWNLLEHCRIEDAYRGVHFHFSRLALTDSQVTNCYRGAQFQEATVLMRGNRFSGNYSAVQGRDSEVQLIANTVSDNFQGINFLRTRLTARGNRVVRNAREGVRIREGASVFEENLVAANRFGILVQDASFGGFERNSISNNEEVGLSLKKCDNMEVRGNFIAGNGVNGINLQESRGRIRGNLVSDNGERGIGILSFTGSLEENDFEGNRLCAVDQEGKEDVAAPRNWWGGPAQRALCAPQRGEGRVLAGEPLPRPVPFTWPLPLVEGGVTWRGALAVQGKVTVPRGAALTVAPGTKVLFGEGGGLSIYGRIVADGAPEERILFTSATRKEAGGWDEILLEHADGSSFADCVFEYASWGVHSHFTTLSVRSSLFHGNLGGMRFRSGPVTISGSLFTDNGIGLRAFRGNAVVTGNTFTANGVGVFVREKGSGIFLKGNNLFGNSDYNIRLGDFNDEDVAAPGNWWGSAEPQSTIYDARREPGIGTVRYAPLLSAAVPGAGVKR